MRKLIATFVKYPIFANVIIIVVVVAGMIALHNINSSFFPEMSSNMISVSVYNQGASPVEMEEGVTARLESALRGITGIQEITSVSSENNSSIDIETDRSYDIDEILTEIKNTIDGVSGLPSGAERPFVSKGSNTARAMWVALSGTDDLMELQNSARLIENELLNSGKISHINLRGTASPELVVEVDEFQLQRYNISLQTFVNAVRSNNQDLSAGQIESNGEDLLIRLRSRSTDTEKIANIPILTDENGYSVKIGDIAEVRKQLPESYNPVFRAQEPSITFAIEKTPEQDLEEIDTFVKEFIEEFNAKNSVLKLRLHFSFLEMLSDRLQVLQTNGIVGFILVIVTLTLFLRFGLSFWVAFGIPFSLLAMFIFAWYNGVTLNMLSTIGMILVIGILVDDGIVIAENIYTHFENGKSPMKAAIDGTMEVVPAVLTSVTTTIVAFFPFLFMQGTNLEYMSDMAFVVILVLALSLLEAFFILPSHLASKHVLHNRKSHKGLHRVKEVLENSLSTLRDKIYDPYIRWALKHKPIIFAIPIFFILVFFGMYKGGIVKSTYYPVMGFSDFEINIAFIPGSTEELTYKYLHRFEDAVWEVNEDLKKELNTELDLIADTRLHVGRAFSWVEQGSHAGVIIVTPENLDEFNISGMKVANAVKAKIGPVPEANKFSIGGRNRWGSPVSISMMSKNTANLEAAKEKLLLELKSVPELKNIADNNAQGRKEIGIKLKSVAYALGFSETALVSQIRTAIYGQQIQRMQDVNDEIRVWVKYPEADRSSLGQLENMRITSTSGSYLLKDLVDFDVKRGPVSIRRYNGRREVRISADLTDPYASVPTIIRDIESNVITSLRANYPDVEFSFQGQRRASMQAVNKLNVNFAIAFAVILIILIIHFKNFSQTFIILSVIPFSLVGSVFGHWIHGKPLSLFSVLGMVALSGVVINDAVVYLSKFNSLIRDENKLKFSIIKAGKSRLRPIILTSITTCIGLYPLIFESSHQAQFLIPMAISLAYGVAFGTIGILLFFPIYIDLLNGWKQLISWVWRGKRTEPEHVEAALILKQRDRELEGV